MITKRAIDSFVSRHNLPDKFHRLINAHYRSLVHWLAKRGHEKTPLLLGISGAQGTGKSTLADFLKLMLETDYGWHVAVLSMDDFYYTQVERQQLSTEIHPLLKTRGVPGTHDMQLLTNCIEKILKLGQNRALSTPLFSKSRDERARHGTWPVVTGPVNLIILEGWCVGSVPQKSDALLHPVNRLESDLDSEGTWRRFVNRKLQNEYATVFRKLDFLFFLQAPDFETVFLWRLEQEKKLADRVQDDGSGIMNREQLMGFMQHYERLTQANLVSLPMIADIILRLDRNHDCVKRTETFRHGRQQGRLSKTPGS